MDLKNLLKDIAGEVMAEKMGSIFLPWHSITLRALSVKVS